MEHVWVQATDSMKMSMTQATVERNAAVAHMRRLKQEIDQMQRDRDNVGTQLVTKSHTFIQCISSRGK